MSYVAIDNNSVIVYIGCHEANWQHNPRYRSGRGHAELLKAPGTQVVFGGHREEAIEKLQTPIPALCL
jgi:hypothetical protein